MWSLLETSFCLILQRGALRQELYLSVGIDLAVGGQSIVQSEESVQHWPWSRGGHSLPGKDRFSGERGGCELLSQTLPGADCTGR